MKKLFLITILFSVLHQVNAQKMMEVGIGSGLGKSIHAYFEQSLNDKYTLQGAIGLNWQPTTVTESGDGSIGSAPFLYTPYKTNKLKVSLGVKRYFSEGFKKWFLDSHLQYTHGIYIEESFPKEKPKDEMHLNFGVGYKWVTPPRITIEPLIGFSFGYYLDNDLNYFIINSLLSLRLGYRF